MKKIYQILTLAVVMLFTFSNAKSQIVISGMMINVAGSDSAFEYVQLVATENIDFAANNHSVVFLNNGVANETGWVQGGNITYKFNLTSGAVNRGDVFYVGGNKQKLVGTGSASLSSLIWIRSINTGTTGGDGFGTANNSGVLGNAGGNADGVGVFAGTALDSSMIPIDAVFYGTSIGTAYNGTTSPKKGYKVPTNDHYITAQGLFGQGTNTYLNFGRSLQDTLLSFTGTYDTLANTWVTPRTPTYIPLNVTSPISAINTNITLVGVGVGISKNEQPLEINIYPNPNDGEFQIQNFAETKITIEILNMLGTLVLKTETDKRNIPVSLSDNHKGLYFVRITDSNNQKIVRKVVVK